MESEPEEEPVDAVADTEILLPTTIEGRLDKLEKELDKLLTEEVEPGEEGKERVKEATIPEDMEEILFICPRCATILKQEMKNCPGCGFGFEIGEDV